jgi:chromosome segregation ATPase
MNSEKRSTLLQSEKEELAVSLEAAERARKQAEYESADMREHLNDLTSQANNLSATKRKLESEMQAMHVSMKGFIQQSLTHQTHLGGFGRDAQRVQSIRGTQQEGDG